MGFPPSFLLSQPTAYVIGLLMNRTLPSALFGNTLINHTECIMNNQEHSLPTAPNKLKPRAVPERNRTAYQKGRMDLFLELHVVTRKKGELNCFKTELK